MMDMEAGRKKEDLQRTCRVGVTEEDAGVG